METLLRQKTSEWVNRLDFSQRQVVVQMYKNGVGISAITKIYQVHHSSVRYHLKKAGVYIKGRYGDVNMPSIRQSNQSTALDFYNIKGQKFKLVRTGRDFSSVEDNFEKNFPKSYKDYVQRDADKHSILLKNGLPNFQVKLPDPTVDPFRPKRKFNPTYIEERRKKIKISGTFSILADNTQSV